MSTAILPVPIYIPKPQVRWMVESYISIRGSLYQTPVESDRLHAQTVLVHSKMQSLASNMAALLQRYAASYSASNWALGYIDPHLAAALAAELSADRIESASHLVTVCGMNARRYPSIDEVRMVLRSVTKDQKESVLSDKQVLEVCQQLGKNPNEMVGRNPDVNAMFLWATKRDHSPFLRAVAIAIGNQLAKSQGKYRDVYDRVLSEEGDKNLSPRYQLILAQIEGRAKASATRIFLADFFAILKPQGQHHGQKADNEKGS